jgi:hypothetical protein
VNASHQSINALMWFNGVSPSLVRALMLTTAVSSLTNCAHFNDLRRRRTKDSPFALLAGGITALSSDVDAKEAREVADRAYLTSERLARDYRVIGPPLFHNFLVNIGVRERGLCFQWARDLFAKLNEVPLRTLALHWGAARAGTWREHNCVVVTAKSRPFEKGIVFDAWRHSGRLFWSPVQTDHYPWKEDAEERIRLTSKRPRQTVARSTL